MGFLRHNRLRIRLLAMQVASLLMEDRPIRAHEREEIARQLHTNIAAHRRALDQMTQLMEHFQEEYRQQLALCERADREVLRQGSWPEYYRVAKRYQQLLMQRDKQISSRWRDVQRAFKQL